MPQRSLPSPPPFLSGVLQSAGIIAAFVAFGLASAGFFSLLDARVELAEGTAWHSQATRPAGGGRRCLAVPLAEFRRSCVGIRTRHR